MKCVCGHERWMHRLCDHDGGVSPCASGGCRCGYFLEMPRGARHASDWEKRELELAALRTAAAGMAAEIERLRAYRDGAIARCREIPGKCFCEHHKPSPLMGCSPLGSLLVRVGFERFHTPGWNNSQYPGCNDPWESA